MTFTTPESLVSGRPYPVTAVGSAAPSALGDFAGETDFTVDRDGTPYRVRGVGVLRDPLVRVHEKDEDHDGKDVRVWEVRQTGDGGFVAETAARF